MFNFPKKVIVNPIAPKYEAVSAYDVISRTKTVLQSFPTYDEAKSYCDSHRGTYSIRYFVKHEGVSAG